MSEGDLTRCVLQVVVALLHRRGVMVGRERRSNGGVGGQWVGCWEGECLREYWVGCLEEECMRE